MLAWRLTVDGRRVPRVPRAGGRPPTGMLGNGPRRSEPRIACKRVGASMLHPAAVEHDVGTSLWTSSRSCVKGGLGRDIITFFTMFRGYDIECLRKRQEQE